MPGASRDARGRFVAKRILHHATVVQIAGVLALTTTQAGARSPLKMTTDIPPEITTPDSVETRLGTLKFFDGLPDKATVEKAYDNLDFMRGVEVFLNTQAAPSLLMNIEGLRPIGAARGRFNEAAHDFTSEQKHKNESE